MADLAEELAALLNRFSQENGSNTPDFLLSEYLLSCLATWNTITVKRDNWFDHTRTLNHRSSFLRGDVYRKPW